MGQKLGIGDAFPDVTLQLVGGASISLPRELTTPYAVVLFYRGHW